MNELTEMIPRLWPNSCCVYLGETWCGGVVRILSLKRMTSLYQITHADDSTVGVCMCVCVIKMGPVVMGDSTLRLTYDCPTGEHPEN